MKIVSNEYKENIKKFGRELNDKITYELNNETITLNSEINSATPMFKSNVLKSAMKQLEIDSKVDIPLNTVLTYEFGVKVGSEYEYINYGNYIVYSSEKQEDTNSYRIVCYDKMLYSMKDYESLGVTYPITIRNYISALCTHLGLTFANANQTFVNYDKEIPSELYLDNQGNSLGYTFRDVLDELAEVTASTICINDNDELEIRYVSSSTETVEGSELHINSDSENVADLQITGDTYQQVYSGRNKFNNRIERKEQGSYSRMTDTTINTGKRLTYTDATSTTTQFLIYAVMDLTNYVGKTIRFKTNFTPSASNKGRFIIGLCNSDGTNRTIKSTSNTSGSTASFVVPTLSGEQTYLLVNLYANTESGTVNANDYVEYTNMIITIDDEDMTYEPYMSPSPDYPQNVETVTGRQGIVVSGKNLLDISDITNKTGITRVDDVITLNGTPSSASWTLTKPFVLKANITYTLSLTNTYANASNSTFILRNGNTNIFGVKYNDSDKQTRYTPTQDVVVDTLRIYRDNAVTFDNYSFSVQLEVGSSSTEYEKYKGNSYEINLGKNLYDPSFRRSDNTIYGNNCTVTESNGTYTMVATSTDAFMWGAKNVGDSYDTMRGQLFEFEAETYTATISNTLFTKNFVTFYDENKVSLGFTSKTSNTFSFNKSDKANAKYFTIRFGYQNSVSGTTYTYQIQLEKGSRATDYSAYKTPIKLYNMGVSKDRIYKNGDNWYLEKSTNKLVLDGTETGWAYNDSDKYFYNTSYNFGNNVPLTMTDDNKNDYLQYSSHFLLNKSSFVEADDITVPERSTTPSYNNNLQITNLDALYNETTVYTKTQNNSYGTYWTEFTLNQKVDKLKVRFSFFGSEIYDISQKITFTIIFNKNIFDNITRVSQVQEFRQGHNWNTITGYKVKRVPCTSTNYQSLEITLPPLSNYQDTGRFTNFEIVIDGDFDGSINNLYGTFAPFLNTDYYTPPTYNISEFYPVQNTGNKLMFRNVDIDNVSDFTTWLGNNNVEVYYPLATPVVTQITDTELINQLNAFELIKGINNILVDSNDLATILRLTYYVESVTIDEDSLKNINVTFKERYGPINTLILSRSADSDNIALSIPADLSDDDKNAIKISDNQILNGNNRDTFMSGILNKLYGLEYYLNDYVSTGITYLDMCDSYKVRVGETDYNCIMFNDDTEINQGLSETVYTEKPDDSVNNYKNISDTDRQLQQTTLEVDKQNGRIKAVAKTITLTVSDDGDSAGIVIKAYGEDGSEVSSSSGTITLSGLVKFIDLSTSGSTTINGDNISTGSIKSNNYYSDVSGTKIDLSNGVIDSKDFKVSSTGQITASGGYIGGWELYNGNLRASDNNGNVVQLSPQYLSVSGPDVNISYPWVLVAQLLKWVNDNRNNNNS